MGQDFPKLIFPELNLDILILPGGKFGTPGENSHRLVFFPACSTGVGRALCFWFVRQNFKRIFWPGFGFWELGSRGIVPCFVVVISPEKKEVIKERTRC